MVQTTKIIEKHTVENWFARLTHAAVALTALAICYASTAAAEIVRTENVEAELVSARTSIAPGETVHIALRKKIREHWHTYWRNAGDSGEPTVMYWELPEGFAASEFEWPLPKSITVGGIITSYGYEGDLLLPMAITAPADMPVGAPVTLVADATWLVCEEICIPEEARLSLTLPTAEEPGAPDPNWGAAITQTLADVPRPAGFEATISRAGDFVRLSVVDEAIASAISENAFRAAHFFPFQDDKIDHNAAQEPILGTRGLSLDLTPTFGLRDELVATRGVLAFETLREGAWARMGVEIEASPAETQAAALNIGGPSAAGSAGGGGFFSGGGGVFGYLIGAFIGGLILNLMPCVFPVLFIKALGFVQHAHGSSGQVRRHGLMFLAGVLGSFALIGAILVALKAAGQAVGWGFQLQDPLFVAVLALVMFAIGLNLLGVFEIGTSLQGAGSGLAAKSGDAGAFFTGVLAVVVATPCTAPFMAAALGFALAQPAYVSMAVFLSLGLGLAAPFVLLSFAPSLLSALPKPGAWMDTLKQLFAFPMFATAIWLLWTIAQQAGADGVGAALLAMLGLGLVIWTFKTVGASSGAMAWIGRAASILVLAGTLALIVNVRGDTATASTGENTDLALVDEAWSPEKVEALRAEGKSVFVDFTAAWCITCQFNKRVALKTAATIAAFEAHNVTFLTADWTNRDDVIARELSAHGRSGVPLYLLYGPEGEPSVLPQVLNEAIVADALASLSGQS